MQNGNGTVDIAIVGAGATGVELSAELHNAVKELRTYGFGDLDSSKLNVNLVEAGERILPALPPRISSAAHQELVKLGVNVRTATMVTQADKDGLTTKDGEKIPAQIMVWAAGIKAPDFIKDIAGLETNRINQLVVKTRCKPLVMTTSSLSATWLNVPSQMAHLCRHELRLRTKWQVKRSLTLWLSLMVASLKHTNTKTTAL